MKKFFLLALIVKSMVLFSSCIREPELPDYVIAITIHTVRAEVNNENGILAITVRPDYTSIEIIEDFLPGTPPVFMRNVIQNVNVHTVYDFNENYEASRNVIRILQLRTSPDEIPFDELIDRLEFVNATFEFTEQPTADVVQFEVTGRLSDTGEFRIDTNRLELRPAN